MSNYVYATLVGGIIVQKKRAMAWSRESLDRDTLEQAIANKAAERMAKEIDRGILWSMLEQSGWTPVTLSRLQDNRHAVDITVWLEEHCQQQFKRNGREFLFESKEDAVYFALKWVA